MADEAGARGRIDPFDPRFDSGSGAPARPAAAPRPGRSLVPSRGPGPDPDDPKVRILRIAIPALAIAGILVVGLVFFTGLSPGGSSLVVGPVADVRAAVSERPLRVCFNGTNPCAWLTLVDGAVVAFNTNGPLAEEYGRQGVAWCPTSGWFGANATGSRWDARGLVVEGPAPRSLDRFTTSVDRGGELVVNFASLTAGVPEWQVDPQDIAPRSGAACEQIPFDRDPDLELGDAGP